MATNEFASVTLIDNSEEMIRICNEKIAASHSENIKALKTDLENSDIKERFDIIYSQMAFHHIDDIKKMVGKFFTLLNSEGVLAVADLYTEDGSFHGEGFTGHKGFDPNWLAAEMNSTGFRKTEYTKAYIQKRAEPDGTIKEFPVFLMISKKTQ